MLPGHYLHPGPRKKGSGNPVTTGETANHTVHPRQVMRAHLRVRDDHTMLPLSRTDKPL